ncbi:MAG: hypothetical protein KF865_02740 [Bdellovibrionaceae bacterium]|nr:hypothetical protein [Pseudobdellovibrionaceae bacterium]
MKIHRFIHMFAVLGAAFVFPACMDIRAVDKNRQEEEAVQQAPAEREPGWESSPTPEQDIGEPIVRAMPELHRYRVIIPAKGGFTGLAIQKKRLDRKNQEMVLVNLPVREEQAIDDNVEAGATYVYSWGQWRDQAFQIEGEKTLSIPIDVEIRGDNKADGETAGTLLGEAAAKHKFGRVLFHRDAVLQTDGKDLILRADEIIADQSVIRTFPKDATARRGENGRHGGRLLLEAGKARGTLSVELRGENGGEGFPITHADPALNGARGANGRDGNLVLVSQDCRGSYYCEEKRACSSQPTSGADGSPGKTGHSGLRGFRGGNAASLEVRIQDDSEFTLRPLSEPGLGGRGGPGGPGGEGGEGGEQGAVKGRTFNTVQVSGCQSVQKGQKGPAGSPGPQGPLGPDGLRAPICFWKGDQKDCGS